ARGHAGGSDSRDLARQVMLVAPTRAISRSSDLAEGGGDGFQRGVRSAPERHRLGDGARARQHHPHGPRRTDASVRLDHRGAIGHAEFAFGEIRRECAVGAGRDHERDRCGAGGPRREVAGARARADQLERARPEMRPRARGDPLEAQVPSESAGLEIDGGDDEDAGHASLGRGGPESFSEWIAPFAASLARSHAAYELPAGVSRPENRIAGISRYGMVYGPAPFPSNLSRNGRGAARFRI